MSEDATGTDAAHPLTVTVIPAGLSATSPGGGTAGPTAPDATGTDGGHPLTVTVIPDG
jgi:hypothetical protein